MNSGLAQKINTKAVEIASKVSGVVEEAIDLTSAAFSNARGRQTLMAVTALGAAAGLSHQANGSIVRDPFNVWDPFARAAGESHLVGGSALQSTGGGVLSLRIDVPGFTNPRRTSATAFGNFINPATGLLQGLGITTRHNFEDLDQYGMLTVTAGTGSNVNSSPGQILTLQSRVAYQGADAEFIWFNEPISGLSNAIFGTATGNLVFTGFGRYGSQQQGLIASDGNVRAVLAPYDISGLASSYDGVIYSQGIVSSSNSLAGLGRTVSGDSGGAVFNASDGRLVGMNVFGTNGSLFPGVNGFLDFSTSQFQAEFARVVPAPSSLAVLAGVGGMALRRRR